MTEMLEEPFTRSCPGGHSTGGGGDCIGTHASAIPSPSISLACCPARHVIGEGGGGAGGGSDGGSTAGFKLQSGLAPN